MQVNKVNNQSPAFKMQYINPRKWEPTILKTLMDSSLTKQIDAKYPNAMAEFQQNYDTDSKIGSYVKLNIILAKNKIVNLFDFNKYFDPDQYYSYISEGQKKINNTTLEDIEKRLQMQERKEYLEAKEAAENESIFQRAEEENTKNAKETDNSKAETETRTPFQKFICKIFNIK